MDRCLERTAIRSFGGLKSSTNKDSVEMMVGIKDDTEVTEKRYRGTLTAVSGRLYGWWVTLLESSSPTFRPFVTARGLFVDILSHEDYFTQNPLEAAYAWALICQWKYRGELQFGNQLLPFSPKEIVRGRLFPEHSVRRGGKMINPLTLEEGGLYVAIDQRNTIVEDVLATGETQQSIEREVEMVTIDTDRSKLTDGNHPLCDMLFSNRLM